MALQARYGTPQPAALPLAPHPKVITLPAWPAGTTTASGNAATATDLGNGTGSWASPANAQGSPDTTVATWAVP